MEDTKEKVSKLSSEDENQVSGGSDKGMPYNPGPWNPPESHRCDVCGCACLSKDDDNLVIPFQGGHICLECLKKVEEKLDREVL